jgi:hypothetical protein
LSHAACDLRFDLITLVEWAMRLSKAGRILAVLAGTCLLLTLGCGLLGLAIQQRVIVARDINLQFGQLIIIARGPDPLNCPQQATTTTNLCDLTNSLAARPDVYRVWVFWYTPGHSTQSSQTLAVWRLPLREEKRTQGLRPR